MPGLHIVTDSGAAVGSLLSSADLPVTVIPNQISSSKSLKQANDMRWAAPALPPSAEEYAGLFRTVSRSSSGILCITPSRQISTHWGAACSGAALAAGACPIRVFDSQTFSAAQTLITLRAARLLSVTQELDRLEHDLRGLLTHSYTMMYVDQIEYLARAEILSEQHTFFSAMLGVKPLIALENGRLQAVEKTRTRTQAVERLFEFAAEFGQHAHIVIQHDHGAADAAQRLHERLMSELEGHFDIFVYNPSLAALVGTGALVVSIMEDVLE